MYASTTAIRAAALRHLDILEDAARERQIAMTLAARPTTDRTSTRLSIRPVFSRSVVTLLRSTRYLRTTLAHVVLRMTTSSPSR
jgi:hypothetical protein